VQWAWARQGVALPHNAAAQYALSPHIDGAVDSQGRIHYDRLAIGDLVFFNGLGHVSIYIGNGYMVDAPHTGTSVRILRAEDVRDLRGHADGAARIVA
jgi:cell wall-associated NlpC family hydrolase